MHCFLIIDHFQCRNFSRGLGTILGTQESHLHFEQRKQGLIKVPPPLFYVLKKDPCSRGRTFQGPRKYWGRFCNVERCRCFNTNLTAATFKQ